MDSLVSAPGLIQMVMQILTGMEVKIQEGFIFSALDDHHVLNPIDYRSTLGSRLTETFER